MVSVWVEYISVGRRRVYERLRGLQPFHAYECGTFWHLGRSVRRRGSLMKMDGALDDCGVTDGEQPAARARWPRTLELLGVHASQGGLCTASTSIRAAKASELGVAPRRVSRGILGICRL